MLRDTSYIREYTLRVDRDLVDFLLVHEGAKVSFCIPSVHDLTLTRTAGGLRSLRRLRDLSLQRKHLYCHRVPFFGGGHRSRAA